MESRVLNETRRINIYTPPGYAASSTTRYSLLYLPDGGVAEDFPHVIQTVDEEIRAGRIRPIIVIGIENTERRRDMTGPTEVEDDKKIAPKVGGSAAFRSFIKSELMPLVSRRVRGNGETGIMGESLVGLFIAETFLLDPAMFDHYVSLSPSLYWNNQALVKAAPQRLKLMPSRKTTFFLTVAGDDNIDNAEDRLADILKAGAPKSLRWTYQPMPNEKHSTIYIAAAPTALRFTFGTSAK